MHRRNLTGFEVSVSSSRSMNQQVSFSLNGPASTECSLDGHFVFTVSSTDAAAPIDVSSLRAKDQPLCSPAVTTSNTAVFRIEVTECGATMRVKLSL